MGAIVPGVQGLALTDTPEDGAPVPIGISVDETAPTAAGEGDVRRVRGSAEGDVMFQPAFEGASIANAEGIFAQGPAASDSPELGNPVALGGSVDNTAPAAAAEGDIRRWRVTPEGYGLSTLFTNVGGVADGRSNSVAALNTRGEDDTGQIMQVVTRPSGLAPDGNWDRLRTLGDVGQDGLGQICATPAVPGAGAVTSILVRTVADSSVRVTAITPTSGTRIRVIAIQAQTESTTGAAFEFYFGTGTTILTTLANAIARFWIDLTDNPDSSWSFPDGGGPVGAVDAVLSIRTDRDIADAGFLTIHYREE